MKSIESVMLIKECCAGINYFLEDGTYLGLLTYDGKLSDFRAVIIQTRVNYRISTREDVYKMLRKATYTLLNVYIEKIIDISDVEREKYKNRTVIQYDGWIKKLQNWKRFEYDSPSNNSTNRIRKLSIDWVKRRILERLKEGLSKKPLKLGEKVNARYFTNQKARLETFRNKHDGKRCFIIGNGPSLNKIDLNYLRDEYTFAVNSFYYKTREIGFIPTYFIVEDNHVIDDNLDEINAINNSIRFFPDIHAPKIIDNEYTFFLLTDYGYYREGHPFYVAPRFSKNIQDVVYTGQSVTIINLQLAYYMGFSEVYLIGMDFNYVVPESTYVDGVNYHSKDDDPNHFHKDYFGKGKKWHDPKLDRVMLAYEKAKKVFEEDGRKIYNASVGGKLEIFDRIEYRALF